jgi:hypothetical protein
MAKNHAKQRTEGGTFLKGVSGNPAGRPKGSKNAITLLKQSLELQLRDQAAIDMPAVLAKAVELALEGDRQMIKLLVDAHLSKGTNDQAKAAEKVAIQINSHGSSAEVKEVPRTTIDAEPIEDNDS